MQTVTLGNGESVRNKVVLHSWIHLDNVPPLPPHVQIMNSTVPGVTSWEFLPRAEHHHVTSILKGSSKLGCVDGQTKWLVGGGTNINMRVLGDRRTSSTVGRGGGGREEGCG